MKKQIDSIRKYRSNIEVFLDNGEHFRIDFDGQEGLCTRKEFIEADPRIAEMRPEDQNAILDAIEQQYNTDFFAKE